MLTYIMLQVRNVDLAVFVGPNPLMLTPSPSLTRQTIQNWKVVETAASHSNYSDSDSDERCTFGGGGKNLVLAELLFSLIGGKPRFV